jgi:hypothetical protein
MACGQLKDINLVIQVSRWTSSRKKTVNKTMSGNILFKLLKIKLKRKPEKCLHKNIYRDATIQKTSESSLESEDSIR